MVAWAWCRIFLNCFAIFCFCSFIFVSSAKSSPQQLNILILHSYHQGLQWTDSISEGIEEGLSSISNNVELHYEYLDTKRNSGEEYQDYLVNFIRFKSKLNKIEYSLIICSDNNALNFIQKYGAELYPEIPVVFCGVNNFKPDLVKGIEHVTGVVETIDYSGTLQLMSDIHPDRNNIVVILDKTPTGQSIKKEFELAADKFIDRFTFKFYQDFCLKEITQPISKLGENDLIYLLTFNRDRSGAFISYADAIRLLHDASKVPIYGSWEFYFGNGIVGGIITSGYEQGFAAAQKTIKIIEGHPADTIPVQLTNTNKAMFDSRELEVFGITPFMLPEDSFISFQRPGIYERYQAFILSVLSIIPICACILAWRLIVAKGRQAVLARINKELDLRVDEQTKKLKLKNSELEKEILERIKLEKEIRKVASTDSLTGIKNRRSFIDYVKSEFSRCKRYDRTVSMLVMDIDNFKSVNDTYGHHVGDICLKKFVQVCLGELRGSDGFGRLGGEEFAILLVETDVEGATNIAERLRQAVADSVICEGINSFNVTVSIGITGVLDTDKQVEELIQRADQAMYQAKGQGRNMVITV